MESRRKFKADLNEKHVQDMFARKKPKYNKVKKVSEESKRPDVLYSIPSDMLPTKKVKEKIRELSKPEHWVFPEVKPAAMVSRQDVFKAEKDNIKKGLEQKLTIHRTAKFIDSAINPKPRQPAMKDVDSVEDIRNKFGSTTDKDLGLFERRNHSKEFLNNFFTRANRLAQEQKEEARKLRKSVVKKVPKLAWLEPGEDEIVL